MTEITIRDLCGMTEFRAAEALQRSVWGAGDKEDPADLMMVVQHEGGICAGAFREDQLLGYIFGFATREPHIQHSHRLAVLEQARGLGLGLRLKWYQRDWGLARGITHIRWTYDPLRSPNAGLNIARLGAISDTYYPDYYGEMEGINRGAPSDRLLADWYLNSPHVAACARGQTALPTDFLANALRLPIPIDFGAMLEADPDAALRERLTFRAALQDAFTKGYVLRGYETITRNYLLIKDR